MSAQTVEAPLTAVRSAGAAAVGRTTAKAGTPAANEEPGANLVALGLLLKQATLMAGFVACVVGMLCARWAEKTWVMAVFCGSLAALVSAMAGTILSRIFFEQIKTSQDPAAAERSAMNSANTATK